ncbi:MAG: ferritin family protein [Candidatus Latescibacteria bacterium]|nr:ferritin family protein [Candidatus Latescibacterota bacterium]
MKFNSAESIKILELALKRENETGSFYSDCIRKSKSPATANILKGLVADEQFHADILTKLIAEAKSDGSIESIGTKATADVKTRLDNAHINSSMTDKAFSVENATAMDMLKKALNIEKESFDLYSKASKDSEESELKAIYSYLAAEENKHYVTIKNVISYFEHPDEWLYEEENLIFRRG